MGACLVGLMWIGRSDEGGTWVDPAPELEPGREMRGRRERVGVRVVCCAVWERGIEGE